MEGFSFEYLLMSHSYALKVDFICKMCQNIIMSNKANTVCYKNKGSVECVLYTVLCSMGTFDTALLCMCGGVFSIITLKNTDMSEHGS